MANISVRLPDGTLQPMTHPDDWTDEQVKEAIYKNFPEHAPQGNQSQSLPETDPTQERTGFKALGADVLHGLGQALKSGRGFIKDIPDNLAKSNEDISKRPIAGRLHRAGQLVAGAADFGKSVLNMPHDILKELGQKEIIPDWLKKYNELPFTHIPEDTGIEKAFGLEADPEKGDRLTRAIPSMAATGLGGAALVKQGVKAFKVPDLKNSIRQTQAHVNKQTAESAQIFDKVEKEVGARGVAKIPIQKSVLNSAQTYLAKTPANRELIKRAKTGDYQALRSLQADLRVKGEKALSSALAAENKMGEEILSTRDQVNKSIQQHLEDTGHKDLASLLNKARNDYRDIQKTYFSTPALAKVFGKSQKVPKNPKTLLTEESTEMNKFMSTHPEIKEALAKALKHEKNNKPLKGLGKLATGALVGEEIARFLHK